MNADQLKGKWMQFIGDLKLQWGKFRADDLRQIEGNYDKILGMLQERYGSSCVSLVQERYGEDKYELIKWARRGQQPQLETTNETHTDRNGRQPNYDIGNEKTKRTLPLTPLSQ